MTIFISTGAYEAQHGRKPLVTYDLWTFININTRALFKTSGTWRDAQQQLIDFVGVKPEQHERQWELQP